MLRPAAFALLPFVLVAVARKLEAALGLVLHTGLRDPELLSSALAVVAADPVGCAANVGAWTAGGLLAWGALTWWRSASEGLAFCVAATREASTFAPLWLLPATTLLGVLALAARATWPYGHTLAVALTQDLSFGRDACVVAALVARRMPALRIPAPRAGRRVLRVLPRLRAPHSRVGPPMGQPSRQRAQVPAHGGGPGPPPQPGRRARVRALGGAARRCPSRRRPPAAAGGLLRESDGHAGRARRRARAAVGRDAIRATRITRQTIGGKDGGVYHVLAPGPSLLLAPTLRVDRALNLRFHTPGPPRGLGPLDERAGRRCW